MTREFAADVARAPGAPPPSSGRGFWWACAIGAPCVALATAALGFGIAPHDLAGDITSLVLWSVAEEIVFRAWMQPALLRFESMRVATFSITRANALTSLLFAALHAWRHPVVVALAIFPVSLVLGQARDKSGRVGPAALLHVYFNLLLYGATLLVAALR